MSEGDKKIATDSVSAIVHGIIGEIQEGIKADQPERKDKIKIPEDYEGDPHTVDNWIRQMMIYFQEKEIMNDWKKITIALPKIAKVIQGNRLVEDYTIDFMQWMNLTGFDNTALVDKYR
ncbi:hypothetical protein BDQ17DRAFT_1332683 [Cyathus striatus]|nr:hypothetical protein BDQ17DRAFT_1332683 [Cyathus striatus]